jgi:Xaa-Pro aminopeptidase
LRGDTFYFKPAFPLQPEKSNQTNYKKRTPHLQIEAEKIFIFPVCAVNTGSRFLTGEFLRMDKYTYKTRLKVVRAGIVRLKADCLIATEPANVTYLTGFTGDDSWVVVLPRAAALVTDSRYTEQAAAQCRFCRIVERKEAMAKAIAELLRNRSGIKTAAVEKSISLANFQSLKKTLSCRLKTAEGIVESARRKKDRAEVAAVRASAKIAARAFKSVLRQVKPGLTENELAGIVDFEIRKAGGTNSFTTIVAFGPNASRPHHQPTSRKLRKNDNVLIDFGVRLDGYCCDLTRCFSVGTPSRLYTKVYTVVKRAQAAAIRMVKAGVEISRVDTTARKIIKKADLPVYGHGTGHGLGLEVHELPAISGKAKGKLQTGDVITIEPAVYIPGRLGVRIEDDCLVTNDGSVALTATCPGG